MHTRCVTGSLPLAGQLTMIRALLDRLYLVASMLVSIKTTCLRSWLAKRTGEIANRSQGPGSGVCRRRIMAGSSWILAADVIWLHLPFRRPTGRRGPDRRRLASSLPALNLAERLHTITPVMSKTSAQLNKSSGKQTIACHNQSHSIGSQSCARADSTLCDLPSSVCYLFATFRYNSLRCGRGGQSHSAFAVVVRSVC